MTTGFHFRGMTPDQSIRDAADEVLTKVLEAAPHEATAIALLDREGEHTYRCSIDVYSRQGPFIAEAVDTTPYEAIRRLERSILRKFNKGQRNRIPGASGIRAVPQPAA